jgi:hypothetical protein
MLAPRVTRPTGFEPGERPGRHFAILLGEYRSGNRCREGTRQIPWHRDRDQLRSVIKVSRDDRVTTKAENENELHA